MPEIRFKAQRRSSGSYRAISKSGDLEYDSDPTASDGIWLHAPDGHRLIGIDCDKKTGEFRLFFNEADFKKEV